MKITICYTPNSERGVEGSYLRLFCLHNNPILSMIYDENVVQGGGEI